MKTQTKFNIFIEALKYFCFLGLIVSINTENLSGTIFYALTTTLSIFLKEIYKEKLK